MSWKKQEMLASHLESIQQKMETKEITPQIRNEEIEIGYNIFKEQREDKEQWRLKSRSLWLKVGDKKTSYFHHQGKIRGKRNKVT